MLKYEYIFTQNLLKPRLRRLPPAGIPPELTAWPFAKKVTNYHSSAIGYQQMVIL
jgi:hypothetical protein